MIKMKKQKSEPAFLDSQQPNEVPRNSSENNKEAEKILNAFKEVQETEKKTRKPRQPKIVEPDKNESFAKVATISAHLGMSIIVARLPKPIPLSKEESEVFDAAFTEAAKEYAPLLAKYGALFNLIASFGLIILPRLEFGKKENETESSNNIREDRNGKDITIETINSRLDEGGSN